MASNNSTQLHPEIGKATVRIITFYFRIGSSKYFTETNIAGLRRASFYSIFDGIPFSINILLMQSSAVSPQAYVDLLPEERKEAIGKLRDTIGKHLPKGFEEVMNYGMIGYVVPHSLYPAGYHCSPTQPLTFMNIASQKNYIALYHMGLYANKELYDWFINEYFTINKKKPDMGKSCIRFKKVNEIPYELIGELATKLTTRQWIAIYEQLIKK